MGLFDFLLAKKQTASVAKERLRIIVAQSTSFSPSGASTCSRWRMTQWSGLWALRRIAASSIGL